MDQKLARALKRSLPGSPKVDVRGDHDGEHIYCKWDDGSQLNMQHKGSRVLYTGIISHERDLYRQVCETQPKFWRRRGVTHFTTSLTADADPVLFEHANWERWPDEPRTPGNHIWWINETED